MIIKFSYFLDSICGGILTSPSGTVSSPNYPSYYPRNIHCLWMIRPLNANTIDIEFEKGYQLVNKDQGQCADYILTTYPGVAEPIEECGLEILDKKILADQVWVEFVTDYLDEGRGFSFKYYTNKQEGEDKKYQRYFVTFWFLFM